MWLTFTLLVLAGVVAADYDHGWTPGTEYTYIVRSRTFTSLSQLEDQYTGIILKATLTVQAKHSKSLTGRVSNCQYARLQEALLNGWDQQISDRKLEFLDLPMSGKPFEIVLKHGVIRDIMVDRATPTWEVNILKSIVGQLQIDSQGENAIEMNEIQVPTNESPYGSFRAMEDSVGGKCEVLYDMAPLSEHLAHTRPQLVPMSKSHGPDVRYIGITKTKNFKKCDQRMDYHFGIGGNKKWDVGSNDNANFLSKSATSRIVISGNLKNFTIESAVTTSKMHISPRFFDQQMGLVVSRMNLTLVEMKYISQPIPKPRNSESAGNLVYIFNNPFSDMEERKVDQRWNQVRKSDGVSSISSSEELAAKRGQNQPRTVFDPSSSSSSSIASSEDNGFWLPKPTLEDPPQNPLLPHFIGYEGKHIGKSDTVDVVKSSLTLVSKISFEIENPSGMISLHTLEKFTILCDLIRTMNKQQILQMSESIPVHSYLGKADSEEDTMKQNSWSVLRDAVTQAGTGPALLVIKQWIERQDIQAGLDLASILLRIPKTARTPTADYVKTYFELVTSKAVKEQRLLYPSAIIAFAELVEASRVNTKSLHNRYPVHTFGRMASKHDTSVETVYIPYMAGELSKAVKEKDNVGIQTYITALGTIGHPKILAIFEPYLEGKVHVNVFQRTLMVAALGKLAEHAPKLARSVLYKIYLNTMEPHEVRCTAVFLLMKTDPPLSMLQRMAEFTNYDTNRHVNSAVQSTLLSLSELTNPEYKELAKKCRTAAALLSPHDYSFQFSHGYFTDKIDNEKNIVYEMIMNYIGSDDSLIPRALYLGMFSSYGDFKTPPNELLVMYSSMGSVSDMLLEKSAYNKDTVKLAAEKIVEQLNMIPPEAAPFEMSVFWNSKFMTSFFPIDFDILRQVISSFPSLEEQPRKLNLHSFASYDVTLGFPTETGLPFVYSFNVPIFRSMKSTNSKMASGVRTVIRPVYAQKILGRIGFVTPFDHRHFIAGVDVDFQAYLPMNLTVGMTRNKSLKMMVQQVKGEEKSTLIHYSVLPYTAMHDILSLRPVIAGQTAEVVVSGKIVPMSFGQDLFVKFDIEGDSSDTDLWDMDIDSLREKLASPWTMDNDKYFKMDVIMNLDHNSEPEPVILTLSYDSIVGDSVAKGSKKWSPSAKVVELSSLKEQNTQDARKHFLSLIGEQMGSAKLHAVKMELELPSEPENVNGFIFAWANSESESSTRTLFHWHMDSPRYNTQYEVCAASEVLTTPDNTLFFDQAIRSKPKVDFNMGIGFGRKCLHSEITIMGRAKQTADLNEAIRKSLIAKECQEQMKQGNKLLKTCQNAATLAMVLDEIELTMELRSKQLQALINKALASVVSSDYVDARMDPSDPKNAGTNQIDIMIKLSNDLETANMTIYTSAMDIRFNDIDLSDIALTPDDVLVTEDPFTDITNLLYNEINPSCVLDKTKALTFDEKEYPLSLGNCWHVVMTTYPKRNPANPAEKPFIDAHNRVSILSREPHEGKKELKILLGSDEVVFKPSEGQPTASLNGAAVKVSRNSGYQMKGPEGVVFEINKPHEGLIALTSDVYDVYVVFDGERSMIKLSNKYRGSIRGICGNFDGEPSNDFTSPKECSLATSEQFIASYALVQDQCEGNSPMIKQTLDQESCVDWSKNRYSNVISDIESGRDNVELASWGYHNAHQQQETGEKRCSHYGPQVVETDDKVCFTTRPVYKCAAGCTAVERKMKNYQFHCMERTEAAFNLMRRIEKGANPDLSQKPVSMSRPIEVPLSCKAA